MVAGEVFKVSETFEGSDGTLYLKLADGRGWVFENKAGIGTLCVRCQSDSDACLQEGCACAVREGVCNFEKKVLYALSPKQTGAMLS